MIDKEAKEEERRISAQRWRAAREARGLTQTEAAERAGIAQTRICELERGARVPSWIKMIQIAKSIGYDLTVLLPEIKDLLPEINPGPVYSSDQTRYNQGGYGRDGQLEEVLAAELRSRGWVVRRPPD